MQTSAQPESTPTASSLGSADSRSRRVVSFPLERPRLKVRRHLRPRRGGNDGTTAKSLPYCVLGPENQLLCHLAGPQGGLLSLASPLLITGPSGIGKSAFALHLAARHAVQHPIDGQPAVVHYLPAVDFARQYADAINSDDLPPLQSELDEVEILVLDDLHLIADKSAAQEELSNRIDRRAESGKLTILVCRRFPSDTRGLRPRLVSRSMGGLTLNIACPGDEARRVLLGEYFLLHDLVVPPDMVHLLSAGLPDGLTPRDLEGCVKQLNLWCRMNDRAPDMEGIQFALDSLQRDSELSINAITKSVARHFRLRSADLRSSSRQQKIVRARSLAMTLARQLTTHSLHQIGESFGGRDHSTVLHAIRKTEASLVSDADLRRAAAEVTEKLGA
ncbi:helix-turn-helix domain-containing protein [Crateriforma conspicua]|uniref:helix-turn-helix domain-containing protein n=1 Tax=Crateriforma conspicua TaxID=2527996 RepID=UPI0011877AB9|nr:helix-turn-helix domain-containing protein [Crateriforma conspicua]QDV60881.1 Chromosomal replication initiator protein DnaA [Crateriforma conspicua]